MSQSMTRDPLCSASGLPRDTQSYNGILGYIYTYLDLQIKVLQTSKRLQKCIESNGKTVIGLCNILFKIQ